MSGLAPGRAVPIHSARVAAGGRPSDKVTLHRLPTNPADLGKVKHHDGLYEGEHDAIVNEGVWQGGVAG